MNEVESKQLLEAYGISVNRTVAAADPEEAVALAREMQYPLAMKILSQDISHKTEAGGVRLGIRSENEVKNAYDEILRNAQEMFPKARIAEVSLQPMIERQGAELFAGAKKDANFGPAIHGKAGGWGPCC